jgi:phytoene dehydrogenase-like protein
MLPLLGPMRKWSKITVQDFAARFRDPFLREAFAQFFDLPDFPMVGVLMTLAWMHNHDAGYPIGGSLEFSQAIERRYLDLGGEIHYKSRVERILVENDRAVGVCLEDGAEHRADVVISAADGHATIFSMLEGKYADDTIRGYYAELPIFQPMIQVSLGVTRGLSNLPHMVSFPLEKPVTIAGRSRGRMAMKHFCYDPTLAPKGKSAVVVSFESNYAYWKQLSEDRERYDAEKQQIAIAVMEQLDRRLPGFMGQVEVVDVATPLTTERYTGNWQGSIEGWMINRKTIGMMFGNGMRKTLPGLDNFYMVGQWVEPGGGVPTAAMSGRKIVQTLCKKDKKSFITTLP